MRVYKIKFNITLDGKYIPFIDGKKKQEKNKQPSPAVTNKQYTILIKFSFKRDSQERLIFILKY